MNFEGEETIRDIAASLENGERYVRGVLAKMQELRKVGIVSEVSVGSTGSGVAPNYRLDPLGEADHAGMLETFGEVSPTFSGRSHRRIQFDYLDNGNWSRALMSFEDVQILLGELRGFPPSGRSR